MKKFYLFLIAILFAFTSCNNDDVVTNPGQKTSLSEYCGYEIRAKMSDGSSKSTHYYLCLNNEDTTLFNVSVSKQVYLKYNIGDTIECEKKEFNVNDSTIMTNQNSDGGYKIVTIGGEKYMVIKIESKDTTLLNESQK